MPALWQVQGRFTTRRAHAGARGRGAPPGALGQAPPFTGSLAPKDIRSPFLFPVAGQWHSVTAARDVLRRLPHRAPAIYYGGLLWGGCRNGLRY